MTQTMMALVFGLLGAAAGGLQAFLLLRSARRPAASAPLPTRFLIVVVVLALAARAGQLAWAALGWGTGFVGAAALLRRRLR